MMNCFPLMYDDEIFYSLIARYRRMCGIISKRALIKDYYSAIMGQTFTYLPIHFESIVKNMPPTSKVTENYFIMKHTLFPYLTSFVSEQKTKEIYNGMCSGTKQSMLIKNGLCGSTVKFDNFFKYCPQCCDEDMKSLGETYWRRIHQIPGVLFCEKHRVRLKQSTVVMNDNIIEYTAADEYACSIEVEEKNVDIRFFEINEKYIEATEYLLNKNVKRKNLEFIVDFYIDRLRERRLASSNGSIYMKEFLKEFSDFFNQDYLKLMQSSFQIEDETNWLRLFVRKNNKNRHVLRHLLLLQFLDVKVEEFYECSSVTGKINCKKVHNPILDINAKRKAWIDIINNNPDTPRGELKRIGKGIHTYIYKYDREWYEEVTPRYIKKKEKSLVTDWDKKDEECLCMVKKAVDRVLNKEGKPVRLMMGTIRRECGETRYLYNKRLKKTQEYLRAVVEDIQSFRIRKIKWAINEMIKKELAITPYKVQLYAGFGGMNDIKIRTLIINIINEI